MSNAIAVALTIALLIDAAANIARLVSVEIAYKRQAELIRRHELEVEKRIEAAASVVETVAREVLKEGKA